MNAHTALNAYQKVGVQTSVVDASPHHLITLLLEGAIGRIAGAVGAMQRGETGRQGELVGKAISIVDNLRACLDRDLGGDLAATLSGLYDYILERLMAANRDSNPAALAEAGDLLKTILDGWSQLPAEVR
ncbi:MAG: flagellar export chaperone FliS [Parahaliea sp.]